MIGAVPVDRVEPALRPAPPAPPLALDLDAEVELDAAISAERAAPPAAGVPRAFLVTGATGFLGAHLVSELLARTGADVVCLVRAEDGASARARVLESLRARGLPPPEAPGRLRAVPADLERPLLGLTAALFAELAEGTDAILHGAARVNFALSYRRHKAANVGSTRELLRLAAAHHLKPLHHLSSAAIFRVTPAPAVVEVREDDSIRPFGPGLLGGYARSKWVAERVLELARARGLPVQVYRLGYVSGHSATGASSLDDARALLIRWCLENGLAPDVQQPVEMTPVDFAAAAIAHLACSPPRPHGAYHVVNRRRMGWTEMLEALAGLGFPVERVPCERWLEALGRPPPGRRAADPAALLLRERGMHQWLTGSHLELRTEHLDEALAGSGLRCPPFDAALLRRYLEHWLESGFVGRPG